MEQLHEERTYTYQLWSIVGMAVILATHLDHPGGQGGCRQRHCWTHDQGVDEAKVELQEMQI